MLNKRAPYFATDAGVWRRTVEKISAKHGDFEDWDQSAWAAANVYYRRADQAPNGQCTKYRTGEKIAYIMLDGTPVVTNGEYRPELVPPAFCGGCQQSNQFYKDDYMCHVCREARSFSMA